MFIGDLSEFKEVSKELLSRNRIRKIGFLKSEMTVAGLEKTRRVFYGRSLLGAGDAVSEMRMVKDEAEMRIIKRAAGIIDKSIGQAGKLIRVGISEKELAAKFIEIIKDYRAEDISFPPVVAFGANSAYPHHQPTSRKLRKNEVVLIDGGAKFGNYCSDMTRTFFYGKPGDEFKNIYQKVLDVQKMAIKNVKPGAEAREVFKKVWESFEEKALGKFFIHGLGHGIGLEVHEAPSLNLKDKTKIRKNMVVTIEPGLYFPKKWGIRIEDMVIVQKSGARNLMTYPRKLSKISINR